MAFTKHTQSESHQVVSSKGHRTIEEHTKKAGQKRVSSLKATDRELLLAELEEQQKNQQ